jgi:3-oxoacyl-[acyl-carrier-protein] synthase-3
MIDAIGVGILGMGSYLPPRIRENDFWPSSFKPTDDGNRRKDFLAIERSSEGEKNEIAPEIAAAMARFEGDPFGGARRRHVIDDEADTSDMEAEAARGAMREAGVRPEEIDLVLVHSLPPDQVMPSNGPALQAKLGLVNAAAWSLDVSTASFLPQMVAATALVRSGMYRRILLVVSQAASRVVDYTTMGSLALGDGAAAVVIGEVPRGYGLLGHWTRTDGSLRDGVVLAPVTGGKPQRRWWKGDRGPVCFTSFDLHLGKSAGLRSTAFCREACLGALAQAGLSLDDVAFYVGNQSLAWLVDACRRNLGLPAEKTIDTFAEVTNIGTSAVPFNLERAYRAGRLRDGDIVLMYAPGAGFTRASLVYRWRAPGQTGAGAMV